LGLIFTFLFKTLPHLSSGTNHKIRPKLNPMEQYQISYAAEMVSQKEIYQTVLIIRG